jgi:hypothetical protein
MLWEVLWPVWPVVDSRDGGVEAGMTNGVGLSCEIGSIELQNSRLLRIRKCTALSTVL